MRPGPDVRQEPSTGEYQGPHTWGDGPQAELPTIFSEEQQRLIAVLRSRQEGMTIRQLQSSLSWPQGGVERLLEPLLERRVVTRLNTVVPSYVYRSGGADTGVW